MLKKNKKITLLLSGLSGALLVSSAAGVALASCSTTSSSSSSTDVQYSYVIDWNNKDAVERLIIDDNGLVYSDNAMTTIIAVSPKVKLTTIKIPSRVKSIMGYSKVMYKDASGNIVDQIPSGATASSYTKVYQSYGAFQNMESLETVTLEAGSQLQSIGSSAFSGCTTLKSISGLSNTLNYIGTLAFTNCTNLQAIDLSNVINIGAGAFTNCTSLKSVDLSKTIYLGGYAFQNCSSLTSVGSVEQIRTIGLYTFSGAFASGSNITLKFSNLTSVPTSAFENAQGISKVDFSGNTLLSYVDAGAFIGSSVVTVDFTGCSKLSEIRERAFRSCTSLTTVYLPANDATSLTTIGSNAFLDCTSLTTVAPSSGSATTGFVATSKLSTVGAYALANTTITSVDLTNFAISSSVASTAPFGSATSLAYIANLKEVKLPDTLTTLNAGLFYGSGLGTNAGFSLTLPSTITNIKLETTMSISQTPSEIGTSTSLTNVTPFTNSGVTSVDMSKVTSYQTTSGSENAVPNYLFSGDTKLTSVVLKTGTISIGTEAFKNTTALTSVTYPASSDADAIAESTNGFTASDTLTSIGTNAFYNAFSEDSDAVVDLTAMKGQTTAPAAFSESKVATLNLPTTITSISGSSFVNMTKLKSVNFVELTNLTTIAKPNFTNTQLTSIDLSKTKMSTSAFTGEGNLFTGLPTTCVVILPTAIGTFSNVFIGTDNNPVSFSYSNGLPTNLFSITGGVLALSTASQQQLDNLNSVDFSSNNTLFSVGPNTFFGKSKLASVTLGAKGISTQTGTAAGLFSTTTTITANTSNTASPAQYVKASVPFGNNAVLTNLNYSNFTNVSSTGTSEVETLFKSTNSVTWAEVAKIMNSLSYQATATATTAASYSTKNLSAWTDNATSGISPTNSDAVATWTDEKAASGSTAATPASVSFNNSFNSTNDTSSTSISISATDGSKTIVHNGVTWTYSNNGSSITLKANNVNMYKLTNGSNKYIVYFNQTEVTNDGTTYYIPGSQSVTVTLTIATKASSN